MKSVGTKNIETNRLLLRKLKKEDASIAYYNWCNSESVTKYLLWKRHESVEVTKEQYEKWEQEYEDLNTYRWIVEIKDTHELIGTIDVATGFLKFGTCEIGYCYGEKFWGFGYATEALKAIIKYLFEEADAELIYAEYMENNPASGKVMEHAGMKQEGTLRKRVVDKNHQRNDLISYSITREEYLNQTMVDYKLIG
ncbi:MAG: GNAT family N-acetyltransferase [Erysipelotrichaceae bacterium]|nr:GNAT family N-acetyltransferase [Erysipelotrichaceae bacterium]